MANVNIAGDRTSPNSQLRPHSVFQYKQLNKQKSQHPRKEWLQTCHPVPLADIMMALSQTLIKTEEDAAMALQVSNALTQALLQYRLKNVPKELTAVLSTASEQINPVQSKSTESRPGSYNRPMRPKATSVVQAPAQNPSSVPYPHPISAIPSQPSVSSAYTNTVPSSVPTVSDPLLNYTNPVNPTYPTDASAMPQYSRPVATSAQYPPGFSYYEGQYQPPEGYQWGYSAANRGGVPPPPPPKEDLPQPPPENQTY
uniref:Vacuolar protein sorting-associated protein 37C-like n=1 Tax=Crassostrea virginica TaxID=6565 RepID=A0A8B8BXJ5_CRAVI|nr:vacuolar protein sorting-associated protein 37C-like [Crassostrea virginica]